MRQAGSALQGHVAGGHEGAIGGGASSGAWGRTFARFLRHSVQALGVTMPRPLLRLESPDAFWAAVEEPDKPLPGAGGIGTGASPGDPPEEPGGGVSSSIGSMLAIGVTSAAKALAGSPLQKVGSHELRSTHTSMFGPGRFTRSPGRTAGGVDQRKGGVGGRGTGRNRF